MRDRSIWGRPGVAAAHRVGSYIARKATEPSMGRHNLLVVAIAARAKHRDATARRGGTSIVTSAAPTKKAIARAISCDAVCQGVRRRRSFRYPIAQKIIVSRIKPGTLNAGTG